MNAIENIGKIIAVTIAILYILVFDESQTFQWVVFTSVLLTIGIPHGALDHVLPEGGNKTKKLSIFLLKYLGIIAAYFILWIIVPEVSLGIFLLISAYHFGQGHFIQSKIIKLKKITYFVLGCNFLAIILFSDYMATAEILEAIIDIKPFFDYSSIVMIALFVFSLILVSIQNLNKIHLLLAEIIFLSLLLYILPVLLAFILYFGFWHALPSMMAEFESLTARIQQGKIKKFISQLAPFSIISFIGIGIILYLAKSYLNEDQMILLFFILISLISAPHIWVMNNFLEKRKS
jgi:Brp/Blh family beta-carotene 15,15'-monooxygenase